MQSFKYEYAEYFVATNKKSAACARKNENSGSV